MKIAVASSSSRSWSHRCCRARSAPPSCASTTSSSRRRPQAFIAEDAARGVRIIAHRPDKRSAEEYEKKERAGARRPQPRPGRAAHLPRGDRRATPRRSRTTLDVRGVRSRPPPHPALPEPGDPERDRRAAAPHPRPDRAASRRPTSAGPRATRCSTSLKYLALGEGDTAPVTREVLRKAVTNPLERPRIHVG